MGWFMERFLRFLKVVERSGPGFWIHKSMHCRILKYLDCSVFKVYKIIINSRLISIICFKRNFKWLFRQKLQCLVCNDTNKTFTLSIMWKIVVFLGLKVFNSDTSNMFFCSRNVQVNFVEKLLLKIISINIVI